MTSDFEGFSIPDFIHYILNPILILEKEPVFPFWCWVPNKGTTGTIFITSLVWRVPCRGIEPGTSCTLKPMICLMLQCWLIALFKSHWFTVRWFNKGIVIKITYSRSGGDLLARLYCISILLSIISTYLTVPYLLGVNNFWWLWVWTSLYMQSMLKALVLQAWLVKISHV